MSNIHHSTSSNKTNKSKKSEKSKKSQKTTEKSNKRENQEKMHQYMSTEKGIHHIEQDIPLLSRHMLLHHSFPSPPQSYSINHLNSTSSYREPTPIPSFHVQGL